MSTDRRSVGELAMAADQAARQTLLRPDGEEAADAVRTWGEVVQAVTELWEALPVRVASAAELRAHHENPAAPRVGRDIAAVAAAARRLHRELQGSAWPGPGPAHDGLADVTGALLRAGELVRRYEPLPVMAGSARDDDLQAHQTWVMHTLAIVTHGVRRRFENLLQTTPPHTARSTRSTSSGPAAWTAERVQAALDRVEMITLRYVDARWPNQMTGVHEEPVDDDRLGQAAAVWEVQAHRALARSPGIKDLAMVAQGQTHALMTAQILLRAGAVVGVRDSHAESRMTPMLQAAGQSWFGLHDAARQLSHRAPSPDPGLRAAYSELLAASLDLVGTPAAQASPEEIARRVDIAGALRGMQPVLVGGTELAVATQVAAASSEGLRGDPSVLTRALRGAQVPRSERYNGRDGLVHLQKGEQVRGYVFGHSEVAVLMVAVARDERLAWRGVPTAEVREIHWLDDRTRAVTETAAGPTVHAVRLREDATDAAEVSPVELPAGRPVGIPHAVRAGLVARAAEIPRQARGLASATHALTAAPRASTTGHPPRGDRTPAPQPPSSAGEPSRSQPGLSR